MAWTIESYIGVNELRFGMTPAEVAARLGAPAKSRDRGAGRITDFRAPDMPVVEYRGGRADEFIFSRYVPNVVFRGIHVLADDPTEVLRRLMELDQGLVLSAGGTIVSLMLGVGLSGLHDSDGSNKSVGAFQRGGWDEMLAQERV